MSFNYSKHKNSDDHGNFWTSYSDLFMGLSVVFLLLYVTTSLRTGTSNMQQQLNSQKLATENQDLKNQLKMYENAKKDYLAHEASQTEEKQYDELMDKLTLLQEEARDEKNKLQQAAAENEKKEKALNQYQQMVRNVINSNLVAKAKIKKRDNIIEEQDTEITAQDQQISGLQKQVSEKQRLIADGERKIEEANDKLSKKIAELKNAYKKHKITQKVFEKQQAALKAENQKQVEALSETNSKYQAQLSKVKSQLGNVNAQLGQAKNALEQKEGENKNLQARLENQKGEYEGKMQGLKNAFEAEKGRERAAFEAELKKHKLSAAERAKREGEFRAQMAKKEKELNDKLGSLNGQLKDTEGLLAKARAEADARKSIAKEIQKGFKQAGVNAEVDMQTGEVLLDFGQAYFDNDSSKLKNEMVKVLEKAMPVYSRSLLGNPKVAKNINAVEIVGFASPTYKGKMVDPNSTNMEDREAVRYNMDLSYKRAKAIFDYTFNEKNMQFDYQNELLPLVKVSARSFLETLKNRRNVANADEFCKQNDCKKAQRVIIRFSMDGKK